MIVNKIKITQNRPESSRLAFVKALKDVSGLGLKEAKDLADTLHHGFGTGSKTIEISIGVNNGYTKPSPKTIKDIKDFIKYLNENCSGDYTVGGGIAFERESKLLSLGMGSDADYISFISKVMMEKSRTEIEEFMSSIMSNVNREDLQKIFNKLIKEYNYDSNI